MGLPVGIALAGIGVGTILAGLLSHVLSIPDFATTVAVMLGLGVGIDYALFIVTRYRENLHKGASVEDATVVAIDTAGRAVAFAGTTVVISLLGMVLMGLAFITGLAAAAATVVAVTAVASLTLLPALLGFAGQRVEVTRWRGLIAALLVATGLVGRCAHLPAAGHRRDLAGRRRDRRRASPSHRFGGRFPTADHDRSTRPPPTDGAGSSSAARGPRRSAARSSCSRWRSRSSACGSGSPTRATTRRRRPPARPTTCWRPASDRASTGRCCSAPRSPRGRTRRRSRR